MAKVDTSLNTMYNWQEGQIMKASDYKRERNVIITAVNDSSDEIQESNSKQDYFLITQLMEVF